MSNKIILSGISLMFSVMAFSQDIYQMGNFSSEDLYGTARYVGMGGAMSALGADMSVMNTNPAGIGLYRKSDVATSFSIVSQEDAVKFYGKNKTHLSFDNLGLVYAINLGDETSCRFINLGFAYRKQKDFNGLFNAGFISPEYASQTWQMASLKNYWGNTETPLVSAGCNTNLIIPGTNGYEAYGASSNIYNKVQWGSIQNYDFNISTNLSERFFLGLTLGISNIDYSSYSNYYENLLNSNLQAAGSYSLTNRCEVSGVGVNAKFGIIVRPIEDSPFRIGLSASTPTRYKLKMNINPSLENGFNYSSYSTRYVFHNPWKFNFSLGNTFMNCLAVGVEYEYSDYSTAYIGYDDVGGWDNESEDFELNRQAERFLKGVSTFKIGAEYMIDPSFAIRFGYGHVTSPYEAGAYANQYIDSESLFCATSTDYANLTRINRYSVGIGYSFGNTYIDLACQYKHQSAYLYPFNTLEADGSGINKSIATKINLSKTQFVFTIGYRF